MRRKSMRGTAVAMAVMLALTGFPAQSYAQDMFTDGEKTTEPLHLGGAERLFSSDLSETEEQELLTDGEAVPDFSDAQEETAEEGRLLALNGEGTEENPYTVSSADELKSFREAVNNGDNFAGQYVQMTQDIDLEGEALGGPIGSVSNKSFAGTFDGKGYTIKGLNTSGGLFGYVGASSYDPGTICNLTVEGTVTSGAGNCTGGIVGRLNYGTIENCVSYVGVSGAAATGGVAGYAGSGAIVNKCFHSGDVRGTGNFVAGVVGQNYGTIRNCYHVNGTITGSRDYVGGVAGISSNMENCYSVGSVSGSRNVGGAIGKLSGTPEIKNVYYDCPVQTVGAHCAAVQGKPTEEVQAGEVAWLLNNGVTDGTQVYFQTCGTGTPVFEGETVYAVYEQQCPGMEPSGEVTYANTPGTVGEHQFVETPGEKYLKSAANCQSPAVYYKSCTYCGQASETETFTSGEKNPDVYDDGQSAGVIERDESLAAMKGLAPVEYASRIMKSKADEGECLKIMDSFEQGHANVHCSLHQHVSAEGFDLDTYKRLVKRMMQHEDTIVGTFAAPERRNNKLLYATYISRNLSSNGKRDYPFLCVMVDLCNDLNELREMVGFGHKYKTLNIMPSKTVEFRYMNANFNRRYVEAFLQ